MNHLSKKFTRKSYWVSVLTLCVFLYTPISVFAFTDAVGHRYEGAINWAAAYKVVRGNPDGTFAPDRSINRVELLSTLMRKRHIDDVYYYFDEEPCPSIDYSDVFQFHWFHLAVCWGTANDIVSGYPDGSFQPDNPIKFVEAAKMIASFDGVEHFQSGALVAASWYEPYVEYLYERDAVPPTVVRYDQELTRAEFIEMLYRLEKRNNPDMLPLATIRTPHGTIYMELYPEKAPKAVENFMTQARSGFYDVSVFHRVIPGFMIQGGDHTRTGTENVSIWGDLYGHEENDLKMKRGVLATANAGPDTNGSQFFIVQRTEALWLQGKHTIFGKVIAGMDVVDSIAGVRRDDRDRPLEDVTMSISIQ